MTQATFNSLLEIFSKENQAKYSAITHIAVAPSTAIGATLGGYIADGVGLRFVFITSGLGKFSAPFF